jgi:two-component system, OmpR family, sensor histidine kinase ChvG
MNSTSAKWWLPLRSVRGSLLLLGVALVLLPAALLFFAESYERWLIGNLRERLALATARAAASDSQDPVLTGAGILIVRLDANAMPVGETGHLLVTRSLLGDVAKSLVPGADDTERLEQAVAHWPPLAARREVQRALKGQLGFHSDISSSGKTLVAAMARPLPSGGAVYALAASHRGMRRLVLWRQQLLQLLIYSVALALPVLFLFAFRLVRPLERLATAATRFPQEPLADARLLARPDEIGTLARTLNALTQDLERRRQVAADLGADIAHEFKNPLATIAASAELLSSSKTLDAERVAMIVDGIEPSVRRLRRSIDELLSLLRLEQAVPHESWQEVDYGDFVEGILAGYRKAVEHQGWSFRLHRQAPVRVKINPGRWAELLRNLIDNARIQPSPQQTIDVTITLQKAEVITSVRDHGPGVPAGDRDKIFRRFFTRRRPGAAHGTGLGLSVVDTVARAHGGRVELSPHVQDGAEFLVFLPRRP